MTNSASNSKTTPRQKKLTVAILARDCEDRIQTTLECAKKFCGEILVIDTGSTDGTKKIASSHQSRIVDFSWNDDFSAARNFGAKQAEGEWILWLDSGETISDQEAAELYAFIQNEAQSNTAYFFLVQTPPAVDGTIEQVARIRLIPNLPELCFSGRVAEQIQPSLQTQGITTEGLPWRILRPQCDLDPQRRKDRALRNLKLIEKQLLEMKGPQGKIDGRLIALRGEAHSELGQTKEAADTFGRGIRQSEPGSSEMLESYYGLLTTVGDGDSRLELQINICLEALEIFPLDSQLLCALGGYMQSAGQIEMAVRAFELAFDHGQTHPLVWHLRDLPEIIASCYAISLQLQKDDEKAQQVLESSIERFKNSDRLARQLVQLHIKQGRYEEALAVLDPLTEGVSNREALQLAVRGACLASLSEWVPALSYLHTSYEAGCRDPICLKGYSTVLLGIGRWERAEQIVEQWRTIEPQNFEPLKYLREIGRIRHESSTDVNAGLVPRKSERSTPVDGKIIRVDGQETSEATRIPPSVTESMLPSDSNSSTESAN